MPAGFPMSQEQLGHLPQAGHFFSEFNLCVDQESRTYLIPQGYDVRVAHSVCGLSDLLHLDQALPLTGKLIVDRSCSWRISSSAFRLMRYSVLPRRRFWVSCRRWLIMMIGACRVATQDSIKLRRING